MTWVIACTVCFGASEGPLISGSNAGIAVLITVTLALLAAFAVFFLRLRRLAAKAGQAGEPC